MKRPVFIAAVIVLSGMICGINESDHLIKAAALCAAAIMTVYLISEVSREDASLFVSSSSCKRLIAAVCTALFCLGLVRGACVSHYYNTGERSSFFAGYEPGNPGVFDYSLYLKAQGICSTEQYERMRNGSSRSGTADSARKAAVYGDDHARPQQNTRDRDSGDAVYAYGDERAPAELLADNIRDCCGRMLDSSLSEHDAGICRAVLLGDKTSIDGEIRDLYQDAGIAHLLAVSGLHVSMIGAGLYSLKRKRLKLKASLAAAAVSVVLSIYMLVTGAGASVVRAVIMLIMSITAVVCGRNYCMMSALSISAIVLAMLHPYIIFTSGFQLSFGAVAAIALVGQNVIHRTELLFENAYRDNDVNASCGSAARRGTAASSQIGLQKRISRGSRLPKAASAFIISASIQLVTLPIIAYHYYCFPVYGILLNFIVIPLMAVVLASAISVLASGTLAVLLLWLIPEAPPIIMKMLRVINAAAAAPGHYILKLYEYLCGLSLRLPYASVCIGRPTSIQILVYYLMLFAGISLLLRPRKTDRLRIFISLAALMIAASMNSAVLRHHDVSELEIVVLDVGQGDCIYIRNRGEHILADGGSSSRKDVGNRVIESFLLSRGVDRLDAVVVSHADNDHVNGIEYLLGDGSRISIDRLVLPKAAVRDETYDELKSLCDSAALHGERTGIAYPDRSELIAGDDDFSLICLYPGTIGEDRNRQSQVLLLRKDAFSMLLTGDTTAEDERIFSSDAYMDAPMPGRLTVLKAAHHGSGSSNSEELFEYFRPQSVIVSCGRDNRYGHPHDEVVERIDEHGAKLLRTDEGGAVIINVEGGKAELKYFRKKESGSTHFP